MPRVTLAFLLCLSTASQTFAQQPALADPEKAALGQMVMDGIQREAALRAKLIAAEAKLSDIKNQSTQDHKE